MSTVPTRPGQGVCQHTSSAALFVQLTHAQNARLVALDAKKASARCRFCRSRFNWMATTARSRSLTLAAVTRRHAWKWLLCTHCVIEVWHVSATGGAPGVSVSSGRTYMSVVLYRRCANTITSRCLASRVARVSARNAVRNSLDLHRRAPLSLCTISHHPNNPSRVAGETTGTLAQVAARSSQLAHGNTHLCTPAPLQSLAHLPTPRLEARFSPAQ